MVKLTCVLNKANKKESYEEKNIIFEKTIIRINHSTTAKQVQVDKQNSKQKKKSVSEINDVYDRYLKKWHLKKMF